MAFHGSGDTWGGDFSTRERCMLMKSRIYAVLLIVYFAVIFPRPLDGCTGIVAGREATDDGSVLNSQTADGWYDSNLKVIPGEKHPEGSTVPVYYGLLGDEPLPPVELGRIPQAPETYAFFRTAYSCFNEHQLAIGESTIGQKDQLKTFPGEGGAILTVEQLMIIALQRCRTARDAILLIGNLAERYGFLGSCANDGESLSITDPSEAWIMEILGAGFDWQPGSRPGAVWVARRVPDNHAAVLCNVSRITFVDEESADFLFSAGYKDPAIRHGWYDPASGEPFNWRKAYAPDNGPWSPSSMWVRGRLHYIHKRLLPSKQWDPYADTDSYPFSFKPEKPLSIREIMDIFRSGLEGTPFSMEDNPAWLVPGESRNLLKSPKATPFPDRATRELLNIPYMRPIAAKTSYSFITQSRSWLPSAIGGVLWFSPDSPHFSTYAPIYAGAHSIPESWSNFDKTRFSLDSARWAVLLAASLTNGNYQRAIQSLRSIRDPLEKKTLDDFQVWDREAARVFLEKGALPDGWIDERVSGKLMEIHRTYEEIISLLIREGTIIDLW
jgi:dipeptidase